MDSQTHKQKKMRQALRRLVEEVAEAQDVPPNSEMAYRLTFFLAAGLYKSQTKVDIVNELRNEIEASERALRAAVGKK